MNVEFIYEKDMDSSVESHTPMEKWSSLLLQQPEESLKRRKYREGLYDPGSGEICTKYISMSASSILRNPYYKYPAVVDLGIKEALLEPEPKIIYPNDGQDLYLALCKECGLTPISGFHRQLLENKINLRYYGVQQMGFRVMAKALTLNTFVTILDLTDNWICEDGCFHLGQMLAENFTLKVLILCGCRIGSEGARRLFYNLPENRALRELNLSRNQLYDEGVEYLAKVIFLGADVCNIDLSYNSLTDQSVTYLVDALDINNKLTHLNMSWNMLKSANGLFDLCCKLRENQAFLDLNLSWNSYSGLRVGTAITILAKNSSFRHLNLSYNKLSGTGVKAIAKCLKKSSFISLDLSSNPLTYKDAYNLLLPMLQPKVKLQKLILNNVIVGSDFVRLRDEILSLKFRRNAEIIYGEVYVKPVRRRVDIRDLVLNRIDFIAKTKFKRRNPDIALIVMELYKIDPEPMDTMPFVKAISNAGLPMGDELSSQLTNLFAGPFRGKSSTVNLEAMIDFFKRKWPDRKLPPTPPPTPPVPTAKGKKRKHKRQT